MIVLETDRVVLRELTLDDVDALLAVLGDPASMRYYPHPFSREEVVVWIEWCRRGYAERGHGLWGMVLTETGELIGDCGLTLQAVDGEDLVEVGYHVLPSLQRRGLATEAARACVDRAFASLAINRVIALIRPENVPSRRVAQKLGMAVWRRTLRAGFPHDVYSVTRDDWGALRSGA